MVSFRDFIETTNNEKECVVLTNSADKNLVMAGVFKKLESKGKPILARCKESNHKIACNVFGTKQLVAKALGCQVNELVNKLSNAIDHPIVPEIVNKTEAPVFENEMKDVDLSKLPIPLHTNMDGGPYFSSAVIFVYDQELGRNASFHRMMVIDKDKLAIRMLPRHLHKFLDKAEQEGETLKIAIAVGLPINVLLSAATSVELGYNEMTIANSLSPLKMVELENGIQVPAEAEYVYLAEITPEQHSEGPFVDLTETLDFVREQKVIKINQIFHRTDPIHHVLLPGGLEHKILMGMPREPTILREVQNAGLNVTGVNVTPGGCSWLHGVVSINKVNETDGKTAIEAAFKGHKSMKHVIIVDNDIDINVPNDVEWAIATRFQGSKDMVVKENVKGSSLDPSANSKTRETTKIGLDCTKPLNESVHFTRIKYENVDLSDYI